MASTAISERPSRAPPPLRQAVPRLRRVRWLWPVGELLLGVPVAVKIAGANALAVAVIGAAAWFNGFLDAGDLPVVVLVLAISFAVSMGLAILALEPVRALEHTAREILAGDLTARVAVSPLADRDVRRIAQVMNELLASLLAERERIRELAVRVVSTEDGERARVARELEDSIAQSLAAILYEIRGEMDRSTRPDVRERLERLCDVASTTIEELRAVTSSMHPRVLTDLGLVPALEWLARGVRNRHGIVVTINAPRPTPRLPYTVVAVLFAVAREAMARAATQSCVSRVEVALSIDQRGAQLIVSDDGVAGPDEPRADTLPILRERVALVNGSIAIERAPTGGTAVIALLPTGTA